MQNDRELPRDGDLGFAEAVSLGELGSPSRSGGATSGDAYSIAIAHKDGERLVIDVVRGRTGPFNPQEVTREYAALCRQYGISAVTGDKYGKAWVQQAWRDLLGTYLEASLYAWQLYPEALAPFNRGLW